jgi:hypothetical protein
MQSNPFNNQKTSASVLEEKIGSWKLESPIPRNQAIKRLEAVSTFQGIPKGYKVHYRGDDE